MQQPHVLIILCILYIHVQKLGHENLLFHPRMIRPVVGGGGGTHLKQILFYSRKIRAAGGPVKTRTGCQTMECPNGNDRG